MRDDNMNKGKVYGFEPENISLEFMPNQIFKDILKTQTDVEKARIDFFAHPQKSKKLLDAFNIFKEPTFLEGRKPPKNTNDLIDLEAELGGELFHRAWPNIPHKRFFYAYGNWFLHVSDKSAEQTTRFVASEFGATKVIAHSNRLQDEMMSKAEIDNFSLSIKLYRKKISDEIYDSLSPDLY